MKRFGHQQLDFGHRHKYIVFGNQNGGCILGLEIDFHEAIYMNISTSKGKLFNCSFCLSNIYQCSEPFLFKCMADSSKRPKRASASWDQAASSWDTAPSHLCSPCEPLPWDNVLTWKKIYITITSSARRQLEVPPRQNKLQRVLQRASP